MPHETSPNGCTHCGIDQRDHARRYTTGPGWHGYTPPTDAQRLQRMRARNPETPPTPHAPEAPRAALSATESGETRHPRVSGP